ANSAGTSCAPGAPSVSGAGPWTITVAQTCSGTNAFTITYGSGAGGAVTAPTSTSTASSWSMKSKAGAGGTLTDVTNSPLSIPINVGAPSQLAFGVQPSAAAAGVAISPAPTVRIEDAFHNLTSSTSNVTVALNNANGATLGGTTTVAAVAGLATFSN